MSDFLIRNLDEAGDFYNKLKSYWSYNDSLDYAKEIFNYYKIEENYQFIDIELNNYRALALALSDKEPDFLNLLLNSPKIKNKAYSLTDLGESFALGTLFPMENLKLIIIAFEEKKEIFKDYSEETKESFLGSLMNVLLYQKLLESVENEKYFFDFVKRNNINIYENEYNVISGLLYYGRISILEIILNNTPNDEDKLKVIDKDLSGIKVNDSTMEFLKKKKQDYIYQQYKILDTELSRDNTINKKNKPKI